VSVDTVEWCSRFNIDELSGTVTVGVDADVDSSLLDRESSDVVHLTVIASDARNHSSATQLIVRLADVNDNGPEFRSAQPYIGVIAENSLVFRRPVTVKVRHVTERLVLYCRLICLIDSMALI